MGFVLTEEQELIRSTARSFVQSKLPTTHLRALRDRRDEVGFSREIWRELAACGLVGVSFPEVAGGGGLGYAELGLVLEECGRTLAPTPFLSTILLAGNVLLLGRTQHTELLPAVCAGDRILAFAHEEGTRHAPHQIATRAERTAGGYRLTGAKVFVLDGHVADAFVVVARTDAGLTLFLVPRDTPGVTVRRTSMVDSRNAARVELRGVDVPETAIVGDGDVLDRVIDRATVGLCAEMLGGLTEVFERTIAYLKVRRQFGVAIGSFQALKHRAAAMFCEIELTKSIVADALRAVDEGRPDVPVLASAAKAKTSETSLLVANEAVQMHGGIGVTDELDIGLFLKRARVAEMTFGNAAYHRDRFARLQGY